MQDATFWPWLVLAAIAAGTFVLSGAWWLSGHRGGSMDEPGPVPVTLFVTAVAAAIMWIGGWIP